MLFVFHPVYAQEFPIHTEVLDNDFDIVYYILIGYRGGTVVKVLCYIRKVAGSTPAGVIEIFH